MFIVHFTFLIFICLFGTLQTTDIEPTNQPEQRLLVITVATEQTDGFMRFFRSIKINQLKLQVLGNNTKWQGGNIKYFSGGGHKVNLLKTALQAYKDDQNLIIMFTDSYDVIVNGNEKQILDNFSKFNAQVVFSAESFCWPDSTLETSYPEVSVGKRFLNSGGFIGYASTLFEIVTSSEIDNTDDDQLFYTQIYLNQSQKTHWNIKLDHKSNLFQNLYGALSEIQLTFDTNTGQALIRNTLYDTLPLIIHGNGFSKIAINSLGNYLANTWSSVQGCQICLEDKIDLSNKLPEEMPTITIDYPKQRIMILIHNLLDYHDQTVEQFKHKYGHEYGHLEILAKQPEEWQIRTYIMQKSMDLDSDYYLSIDSDARLTNPLTLKLLIEQNRHVIAPLLNVPEKLWSNFWGSLSSEGYYARSHDYIDIVKRNRIGLWNVPYINQAYLIQVPYMATKLSKQNASNTEIQIQNAHLGSFSFVPFELDAPDAELSFCRSLRENGIFMWLDNQHEFGHLIQSEGFNTINKHGELWEIHRNKMDWEARYLNENYSKIVSGEHIIEQPCPDVFWFPIVSETFCDHLIEVLENYGIWSTGKNEDPRLSTGYENVPTVDIHMKQIGFEQHWLHLLRTYIRPVQEKLFMGYYSDPPKAIMNFVVRYRPNEQPSLRPHHDASTYTINIALNRPTIDYQGGGCRFLRYNCTLTDLRKGWSLIHPGRLTHYHEGLRTTNGTRYILVSFVDP